MSSWPALPIGEAFVLEFDDAGLVTRCGECGQEIGHSHLGTCSGSLMNGGSGLVGYRRVQVVKNEPA